MQLLIARANDFTGDASTPSLIAAIKSTWAALNVSSREEAEGRGQCWIHSPFYMQAKERSKAESEAAAAHASDVRSLQLLDAAIDFVTRIATDGWIAVAGTGFQKTAQRLLGRWAPTAAAPVGGGGAHANLARMHPYFVRAADALLAMSGFLCDFASVAAVYDRLSPVDLEAITALCYECNLPVRHPLPGPPNPGDAMPPVFRAGKTVVHVTPALKARVGDARSIDILNRSTGFLLDLYDMKCRATSAGLGGADASRVRRDIDSIRRDVESLHSGELVGGRSYYLLNGTAFEELVLRDGENPGTVGYVVKRLKIAIIDAQTYALELAGYPPGMAPDPKSLVLLDGDVLAQMKHFDIMVVDSLITMLTAGLPVHAVESVDPGIGLSRDEVVRQLEGATGDCVRLDVGEADGRPVSRFHARLFLGQTNALVQSAPVLPGAGGAIPSHLRYAPPCDGVVGPCTTDIMAPLVLHYGPPRPSSWPTDDLSQREAWAKQLEGIAGLEPLVERIRASPFPGRIVAFSTAARPQPRAVGPVLTRIDESNGTQNRLECALARCGMSAAVVPVYLQARQEGHDYLPDFYAPGSLQRAAGWALLALTSAENAATALAATTLSGLVDLLPPAAAAVAAAFPAALQGVAVDSRDAMHGLAIIEAVQEAIGRRESNRKHLAAIAQAAETAATRQGLIRRS
jgi:hypothetical protein